VTLVLPEGVPAELPVKQSVKPFVNLYPVEPGQGINPLY